jgi:hypothetical protein
MQIAKAQIGIRLNEEELNLLVDDLLLTQLRILGGKDFCAIENRPMDFKEYEVSRKKNEQAELSWAVEDIGKGPNP